MRLKTLQIQSGMFIGVRGLGNYDICYSASLRVPQTCFGDKLRLCYGDDNFVGIILRETRERLISQWCVLFNGFFLENQAEKLV